jgi:hypothetical protein
MKKPVKKPVKKKGNKKEAKELDVTKGISSTDRLTKLLEETERELEMLQPQIEKLEKQVDKLKKLKLAKQKLITLKLSLNSIISNFSEDETLGSATRVIEDNLSNVLELKRRHSNFTSSIGTKPSSKKAEISGTFLPDIAFDQVNGILRKKSSINYDLFRAIVFNGGKASTEEIKAYLVENSIRQPASGEGFDAVELTDISSRVNYLVRKGVVKPDGRGTFISTLGWTEETASS